MSRLLAYSSYEAIGRMIVNQPYRLHVGIDDGASDKSETTLLEILRQRVAFWARGRNLRHTRPAIHFRFPINKLPDVAIERSELFLNCEKPLRVGHR